MHHVFFVGTHFLFECAEFLALFVDAALGLVARGLEFLLEPLRLSQFPGCVLRGSFERFALFTDFLLRLLLHTLQIGEFFLMARLIGPESLFFNLKPGFRFFSQTIQLVFPHLLVVALGVHGFAGFFDFLLEPFELHRLFLAVFGVGFELRTGRAQ